MKMLTFINRRDRGAQVARATALGLLALAAALFQAREARAQWATSGTNTTTTNNVGIGTTTPSQMFHVHSIGTWAGTRVTTAATGTTIDDGVHFGYDNAVGAYVWNREASPVVLATSNLERMRISSSGNVGVGTTSPSSLFHLSAATRPALSISDSSGFKARVAKTLGMQSDFSHNVSYDGTGWLLDDTSMGGSSISLGGNFIGINLWTAGAGYRPPSTPLYVHASGNVGVGTVSPGAPLTVNSDSNVTPLLVTGSNTNVVGMALSNTQAGSKAWAFQVAGPTHLNAVPNGSLILRQATDDINSLVISKTGDIGVGTAAPGSKLHVVGNITVTGNINAKYQDVAEWVPSVEKLAAGTVVILDVARDNHVAASSTSYDTRVAGVISAQPGLSLGEAGEGKVLVATTGRVKVKVDATQGPIKVGDILVTSDRQGFAMKSEPVQVGKRQMHTPGTIIGKALESLAGGTGEILVLLSLQ